MSLLYRNPRSVLRDEVALEVGITERIVATLEEAGIREQVREGGEF